MLWNIYHGKFKTASGLIYLGWQFSVSYDLISYLNKGAVSTTVMNRPCSHSELNVELIVYSLEELPRSIEWIDLICLSCLTK